MSSAVHGPSFKKYAETVPDVHLSACCDLDENKARDYQEKYGFANYYTDMERMLDIEKPDAVSLIVPEKLTCEIACRILNLGYPLIMEKPPGKTVAEIDRMIAAAEASGVATRVALNRRYAPHVSKLKELLAQTNDESKLQHVRYEFVRIRRTDADFTLTAIHAIDATRFIVGSDYREVSFHYQEFPELGPTVANVFMDCVFESGVTAHVSLCPVTGMITERCVVHCYDNMFLLDIPIWSGMMTHAAGSLKHIVQGEVVFDDTQLYSQEDQYIASGFYEENVSFFEDLRLNRVPAGDLKNARQSVEVMEAMRDRLPIYRKV